MKLQLRRRRCQRGITLMDSLAAGMVFCIGVAALVKLWAFSFAVSATTDDMGIAYNLGRQQIETVKVNGFSGAAEGNWADLYFNADEALLQTPTGAVFKVTTSVSTPGYPSATAVRTVSVRVYRVSGNSLLYSTGTYLVQGGI